MTPGERPFHEVAVPSEAAVKKVAEAPPDETRRRRGPPKGVVAGEMTYVKVNAEVWREALRRTERLAHIQVVSETEVIVWNHPPPWPRAVSDEG